MDYFTSDLHFGHRNIIRYCNRPFNTVSEMNLGIIENWNNVVTDKDRVFVVGDVALCGTEEAKEYITQLNGHKICIKGNHDGHEKHMLKMGFDEFHYSFDYEMPDGRVALLNHYPVPRELFKNYDILIHGHIHHGPRVRGERLNVSCEIWDFAPVSVDRLCSLETFKDRIDDTVNINIDESGRINLSVSVEVVDFGGVSEHIFKELKKFWGHK
ncbi:MAG: hypothetical protein CMB80_28295 [Flammeovirgaceae bacterium]|nr:hypothetical protein [Flammeovirgaceae bacterium]